MTRIETPTSPREAAELLAGAASVRPRGGATKLGWGAPAPTPPALELRTGGLARVLEHNAGDFTAVLEAGVPLADAQSAFAQAGQMLALDPPDLGGATLGGIFATGDAGPLAHRYGMPRELVLGMTVALSDGAIATSGGKVIKNVAGYDLAKLFTGAFGTLGVILALSVRLHPRPQRTETACGRSDDLDTLAAAARALAAAPLEPLALDVAWRAGSGELLARFAHDATRAVTLLRERGLEADRVEDDAAVWERQRAAQRAGCADGPEGRADRGDETARSSTGAPGDAEAVPSDRAAPHDAETAAIVRVAAAPSRLADVIRAAAARGGTLTGRAALGVSYVALAPGEVAGLRAALLGCACVVLDAPETLRAALDPWGEREGPALELMRRVKARFDPTGTCNPGRYVGGI